MIPLITLPIDDPVLKFLIILGIILAAPLILNKLRIPYLIGLIIAGAVIGPNGFNLVLRDSSIILSGTAGLLYIMFLAGLEIDLADFRKNSARSLIFGLYTFIIPMAMGTLVSYYLLGFSILSSVLLASMFASHTLIAYPIVSRLGVGRDRAVTITVGGTVITDTLALLVLTVIVGMSSGTVDDLFWIKLGTSLLIFVLIVMIGFPILGRWFFKKVEDSISQYIFVLVLLFLAAYLSQIAGIEAIIGAFLAGMAMNRLIPSSSPLMNRVEFVGNAIFIPFFLIGVGMLIDYRAFFSGWETITVGVVMIIIATTAKWLAAWCTQKTFRLSVDQRNLIFGLSNAQAAATLAAVTVGYNVILGTTAEGEPIRLLNDAVLNGTILMVLVTCTTASIYAQRGARNVALSSVGADNGSVDTSENILVALKNGQTVNELIDLTTAIKQKPSEITALNVISNKDEEEATVKNAKKILREAIERAAATDNTAHELLRYDISRTNAIIGVVKEQRVTDLVMELPAKFSNPENRFLRFNDGVLSQTSINSFIYRPVQPLATIKRHLIVIPDKAEKEVGFTLWIRKIWRLALNTGAEIVFYTSPATRQSLMDLIRNNPITCEFGEFADWQDFLIFVREVRSDDCIWVVLSRREKPSYTSAMNKVPQSLTRYFSSNSFVLLYPAQSDESDHNRYLT